VVSKKALGRFWLLARIDLDIDDTSPEQKKLLTTAEEFKTYISNNQQFIPITASATAMARRSPQHLWNRHSTG
jgi:hypothetical protein